MKTQLPGENLELIHELSLPADLYNQKLPIDIPEIPATDLERALENTVLPIDQIDLTPFATLDVKYVYLKKKIIQILPQDLIEMALENIFFMDQINPNSPMLYIFDLNSNNLNGNGRIIPQTDLPTINLRDNNLQEKDSEIFKLLSKPSFNSLSECIHNSEILNLPSPVVDLVGEYAFNSAVYCIIPE